MAHAAASISTGPVLHGQLVRPTVTHVVVAGLSATSGPLMTRVKKMQAGDLIRFSKTGVLGVVTKTTDGFPEKYVHVLHGPDADGEHN